VKANSITKSVGLALALAVGLSVGALGMWAQSDFQGSTHMVSFEEDTIDYNRAESHDPVARLQQRLAKGELKLAYDERLGYLPAVLAALKVDKSSQMLVFSKTSLQRERISPQTPRSLFFNDDVYVGYIPGAPLLEFSAADAKLGGVFYTLEQNETAPPRFVRNNQCLECHASSKTMGVPGHLVRSFATDTLGVADLNSGISLVNHRTPLTDRWGGWYVTGLHGTQTHRGNLVGKEDFSKQEKKPNFHGNLASLGKVIDTTRYPTPHSDIVALMVLEHQTHMHNFLTRLNYEATMGLKQYGHLNYTKSITEAFLKYLLFVEEAPLTSPVQGTSEFAREFARLGPHDPQGRSLREFDLRTRMFKYPCSYLIYSDVFTGLPGQMKEKIYLQLGEILAGRSTHPDFKKIPAETRQAIREILVATKTDLPASWKQAE
jgi:hypothetical protein